MRRRSSASRANCASGSTGRVFVAHNVRFDYGFIRREFARAGRRRGAVPNLCTVRLSRALYPEMPRHNLDAVMERHGIAIEQPPSRHARRAGAAGSSGASCARRGRASELQRALDRAAPRVTLPAALSPDLADDLPEAPGVYRFFGVGEDGARRLFYMSARPTTCANACSITFVAAPTMRKSLKLAAQVRRVEWTETAGELGALLLEAREVRETPAGLQPPAARRRRAVHLVVRRRRGARRSS